MPKKPAPEDAEKCGTCKFFLANATDSYGYCRRFPPVFVTDQEVATWSQPPVDSSEYCGEFRRITHA